MSRVYSGIVFGEQNQKMDYDELELVLGYPQNSIQGIYWNVDISVAGSNTAATNWQPAEYEEIDDIEVTGVVLELYKGYDVNCCPDQIELVEKFRPDENEVYWSIVAKEISEGADDFF